MAFDFAKFNTPEYLAKREEQRKLQEEKDLLIKRTICFTGHRPNKLGDCYSLTGEQSRYISKKLEPVLIDLVEDEDVERFISGGAIGFDQIAFWTVNALKKTYYPHLKNVVAVPFKNQAIKWRGKDSIVWYEKMLQVADEVIYVDEESMYRMEGVNTGEYHVAKMQKRNEYMVDESRFIVACWDGTPGGTGNCVHYASREGKTLYQIMPQHDFKLDVMYGRNG